MLEGRPEPAAAPLLPASRGPRGHDDRSPLGAL